VSALLPPKSLGATSCILSEAANANAPIDVQMAAKKELNGNVEPDTTQKRMVDMPVARQKTR
jgi:hypothetical protein